MQTVKINRKPKWLVTFAVCLICFVLCASLMAAPTLAEPEAAKTAALSSLTATEKDHWEGPNTYADSKSTAHADSFRATSYTVGITVYNAKAQYNIAGKGYTKLTGKVYHVQGAAKESSVAIYAGSGAALTEDDRVYLAAGIKTDSDFTPINISLAGDVKLLQFLVGGSVIFADMEFSTKEEAEPVKFNYKAVTDYKNLYELLDTLDKSKEPKEYIFSATAPVNGAALPSGSLTALVKGSLFFVPLFAGCDTYAAVKADGTLDQSNAFWRGADKLFGTADDVATCVKEEIGGWFWKQTDGTWKAAEPVGKFNYKAVTGYQNLFEVLDTLDNPRSPRQYIFCKTTPANGSALPAEAIAARVKGNVFYVTILEGSGIFLSLNSNGTPNVSSALWWGEDKLFGTADDVETSVKEENGYYFWKQLSGIWKLIEGIIDPEKTTTAPPPTTTTTAAPGETTADETTTVNPFLSTAQPELPKTGTNTFNAGAAAALALLFMGCVYCGFHAFRRRARAH